MENLNAFFAILIGAALRLIIPILITGLAIYFLRRLDAHWQSEGKFVPLPIKKPECWKINNCPPELQKSCPGYLSPLPCWQAMRLPNGYLPEKCFGCKIFRTAPALVDV